MFWKAVFVVRTGVCGTVGGGNGSGGVGVGGGGHGGSESHSGGCDDDDNDGGRSEDSGRCCGGDGVT